MFNFRIINMPDGTQIIDENLKPPYISLTKSQFLKYIDAEEQIENMNKIHMNKKEKEKSNIFKKLLNR